LPPGTPDIIGPIDGVDARVRVSQTLFDAAAWQRWRAAGRGSVAGRADLDAAAEGAAMGGALAWLRAARAAALLDARRLDLLLANELLRLAREQHAAGVSPAIDTTRARTQVVASQAGLLMAGNQLERARLDLARALGRDPGDAPMPSDTLETTSAVTDAPLERAAALAFAREHRPELAAESARLDRARRDARATGLERLPRLDVAADWGLSGQTTDDWRNTRTLALGLAWPVFDGWRREGRISEQRSLAREAEWRLRDTDQQVTADVDAALLDLASGREQHEVARERLRLAEEEVVQASERFRNGVAGNIEVINAQLSLLRARDAEIEARFGWAAARVALARAAGVARGIR
jgi:outer membrane protein TolC